MKYISALILLITSLTAFSQNAEKGVLYRLDSIIEETNGNGLYYWKEVFQYNEYGQEILSINYYRRETSTIWEESSKTEYVYDTNRNLIAVIGYDGITVSYKQEWIYDENKNITKYLDSYWNRASNSWNHHYRYEYLYDTNNKLTRHIEYSYYNSVENRDKKDEYTYDSNENQTSITRYYGNIINDVWLRGEHKCEREYDANGNITKEVLFIWKNNTWINGYRSEYEYVYDSNGYKTKEFSYKWEKNTWKNSCIVEYKYNTEKNTENIIRYYRKHHTWKISDKQDFIYNNGELTLWCWYTWYKKNWFEYEKKEWNYDANGNLLKSLQGTEYTYDLSYSQENMVVPHSFCGSYMFKNNILVEKKQYRADDKCIITKIQLFTSITDKHQINKLPELTTKWKDDVLFVFD